MLDLSHLGGYIPPSLESHPNIRDPPQPECRRSVQCPSAISVLPKKEGEDKDRKDAGGEEGEDEDDHHSHQSHKLTHAPNYLGVSWITQVLYAVVFCFRYTDIFRETSKWNLFFKLFYIISSIYIIAIMRWLFPRTREREIAWKLGAAILAGSLLLSPFAMLIFEGRTQWIFFTVRLSYAHASRACR